MKGMHGAHVIITTESGSTELQKSCKVPLILNNVPIGIINSVSNNFVEATIFLKYALEEIREQDGSVVAFSLKTEET